MPPTSPDPDPSEAPCGPRRSTAPTCRRGRQREAARNDHLLLAAAREVFLTQGADAPVSAIADRAGVGIGSLYRRYGSKEELLQHLCLVSMEQVIASARAALEDTDPWRSLTAHLARCVDAGTGALAPLAAHLDTTPAMWRTSREARALTDALVHRARAAGTLRTDVTGLDLVLLTEQFSRRPPFPDTHEDANTRHRLLAIALAGLRPTPDTPPLPGHPPDPTHYESRWRPPSPEAERI